MEAVVKGTADAWRERIAAHRASGQSIRAWCRENNHHEHAFYWWRSRLGLSPRSAAKRQQRRAVRPLKFAEVVVDRAAAEPPAASFGEPMCLRLGGGRELVLPASMPVGQVVQLVRAIEGVA
jgi:hypothetical protein